MKLLLPAAILVLSCSWAGAQTAAHEVKKPKKVSTSGNNTNNTNNNGNGGDSKNCEKDWVGEGDCAAGGNSGGFTNDKQTIKNCPGGTHAVEDGTCVSDGAGGNATASDSGGLVPPKKTGHKNVTGEKDSSTAPASDKPASGNVCSGHPPVCGFGTKRKCVQGAWACQPSETL